jgi:hypothetical protein
MTKALLIPSPFPCNNSHYPNPPPISPLAPSLPHFPRPKLRHHLRIRIPGDHSLPLRPPLHTAITMPQPPPKPPNLRRNHTPPHNAILQQRHIEIRETHIAAHQIAKEAAGRRGAVVEGLELGANCASDLSDDGCGFGVEVEGCGEQGVRGAGDDC